MSEPRRCPGCQHFNADHNAAGCLRCSCKLPYDPAPGTEPRTEAGRAWHSRGHTSAEHEAYGVGYEVGYEAARLAPAELDRRILERVASQPVGFGDWACVDCRPESSVLVGGFRCVVHEARARLAAPAPEPQP